MIFIDVTTFSKAVKLFFFQNNKKRPFIVVSYLYLIQFNFTPYSFALYLLTIFKNSKGNILHWVFRRLYLSPIGVKRSHHSLLYSQFTIFNTSPTSHLWHNPRYDPPHSLHWVGFTVTRHRGDKIWYSCQYRREKCYCFVGVIEYILVI